MTLILDEAAVEPVWYKPGGIPTWESRAGVDLSRKRISVSELYAVLEDHRVTHLRLHPQEQRGDVERAALKISQHRELMIFYRASLPKIR